MNSTADIEREIREFVNILPGAEIDEEILAEFLLKLPEAIEEVAIGVYYTSEEIGIIKVMYTGKPYDGIRKWRVPVKVSKSGSNYA